MYVSPHKPAESSLKVADFDLHCRQTHSYHNILKIFKNKYIL